MPKDQAFEDEWNKKGFIHSMQAKGKLPRFVTEAQDRKEKVTCDTQRRIFPGVFGRDYAMEQLLQMAAKRVAENAAMLAERNLKYPPTAGSSSDPAVLAAVSGVAKSTCSGAGAAKSTCSGSKVAGASSTGGAKGGKDRTQRRLLQARLKSLEAELVTEQKARVLLEEALQELK